MAILSRTEILQADDIKRELVPVPEWGGEVYVKGLSGAERGKFEMAIIETHGKDTSLNLVDARERLAAYTICDETGARLFTESDIKALGQKSAAALQRVFEVAQKLSGIGDDAIKELTDGLDKAPFDGSASA